MSNTRAKFTIHVISALLCSTVLACGSPGDSSDNSSPGDTGANGDGGEVDMTASGHQNSTFESPDTTASYKLVINDLDEFSSSLEYCVFNFRGQDTEAGQEFTLALFYSDQKCPTTGSYDVTDTHEVTNGEVRGEFNAILRFGPIDGGGLGITQYEPGSGTVEITSNAGGVMEGTVYLETKETNSDAEPPNTVTFEGSFRAENRE